MVMNHSGAFWHVSDGISKFRICNNLFMGVRIPQDVRNRILAQRLSIYAGREVTLEEYVNGFWTPVRDFRSRAEAEEFVASRVHQ